MAQTRIVNIREFRANLTQLLEELQENKTHFIVMRHSTPVAKVTPVSSEASLEQLVEDVKQARTAYKKGKIYTAEEVLGMIDA
jgi:prevent-host-death family protein